MCSAGQHGYGAPSWVCSSRTGRFTNMNTSSASTTRTTDAGETLAAFMRDDMPEPDAFSATIGRVIRNAPETASPFGSLGKWSRCCGTRATSPRPSTWNRCGTISPRSTVSLCTEPIRAKPCTRRTTSRRSNRFATTTPALCRCRTATTVARCRPTPRTTSTHSGSFRRRPSCAPSAGSWPTYCAAGVWINSSGSRRSLPASWQRTR
jgi:hypothetical protein